MDWVEHFYSVTGTWWAIESTVGDRDIQRLELLHAHVGAGPLRVLELGASYGSTAVAMARAGHTVTAVELSERAAAAPDQLAAAAPGSVTMHRANFYQVELEGRFDAVCYWNGFGVGTDADQRTLLRRIRTDWLAPTGLALIDVFNPVVWASWHDDRERLDPAPGYPRELHQHITFDPATSTATDTWWAASEPEHRISQHLRCYSPADLRLLLEGTGLSIATLVGADSQMLRTAHEYLAVLNSPV